MMQYISYEYEYMMKIAYHADVLPRPKKASVPKVGNADKVWASAQSLLRLFQTPINELC